MINMTMQSKKKLALIGAGAIGATHIQIAENSPDFELTTLVDPSEAAKALAQSRGIRWYADYKTMLESDHPDGVIVATPNTTHCDIATACLDRQIPVLVEKPITDTLSSALQLVEAEARTGIPVLVGHHRRHNPILRQARNIVDSGVLGKPVSVTAMATFFKPDAYFDIAWHREAGAGPILINLIHDIDMLRFLVGDIDSVQAMTSNARRGYPVEDTAGAVLRFCNGAIGAVTTSDTTVAPWNWDLCAGEAAHYPRQTENTHFLSGSDGSLSLPGLDIWRYHEKKSWHAPLTQERSTPHLGNPYAEQLHHFAAMIDGRESALCSSLDGMRTLEATLAIHQAALTGQTVTLGSQA
ncbi:MAG: Gfo/Idh/MocA family oxidoreductase [Alcaligenaceae bacterium]|nr:Gfo/Idh/MocA family oxidoreductase [Alcaligenaceae bacterium]